MSQDASSSHTPRFRIFLSHAGEDKETIARPLYRRLRDHGFSVFLDVESFCLGENSPKVMDEAMQTAPIGIFILSPEFIAKYWTMRELLAFVDRYDRAIDANESPPLLISVFYRLKTRECRDSKIFDTYSSLFYKNWLFKRAMEGDISLKDVAHALDKAATLWSIENNCGADNSTRPEMAASRESFVEMVLDKILKHLGIQRRKPVNERKTNVDAQLEQQHEYRACSNVPRNPDRLTLNYGTPTTCEGKLKASVLCRSRSRIVAALATGKGGVGKTCALRGLAEDSEIKEKFSGGILYIQLGNDADTSHLMQGIAKIVNRTGGSKLSKEINAADSLREACEKASDWFEPHRCLFLIDDVWNVNGVDSNVLTTLELMVNTNSRMVYTTRDQYFLRRVDEVIEFKEKETFSELSRQMLMSHAGFEQDTALDGKNMDALEKFLKLCQGLPLGFGIVGSSVRLYSFQCSRKQDAWSEFHNHILSKRKDVMDTEAEEYGKLPKIVDLSLQVLKKRNVYGKFEECFRALCVLKKQQSVPGQMLQKLWNLDKVEETEDLVESFAGVSIVQMTRKDGSVFVTLHDLILDIATRKATEENETQKFFRTLVHNYVSHGQRKERNDALISAKKNDDHSVHHDSVVNEIGAHKRSQGHWLYRTQSRKRFRSGESTAAKVNMSTGQQEANVQPNIAEKQTARTREPAPETERMAEGEVVVRMNEQRASSLAWCHEWWFAEDDGYIHSNICRILGRAGHVEELLWLLCQPQWVVTRLVKDGILCVERDMEHGKAIGEDNASEYADRKEHLEMIEKAARLSAVFVSSNPRIEEAWFQLHGRLLWHATQSKLTSDFVTKMERDAPKPWLKASVGLLEQARGGAPEVVHGAGEVLCMRVEKDVVWVLWTSLRALHVSRYDRTQGQHKHEQLGEEADERVYLIDIASFLPDGRSVVTTGFYSDTIWVWNREASACEQFVEHNCENHDGFIGFCAEGTRVACSITDHSIRLWDTLSGEAAGPLLQGHTERVGCIAMSADGSRIVSGSSDKTLRVWDAKKGIPVGQPLVGHSEAVYCVAVNANGTRIVSGSYDKTVRVWDCQSGNPIWQPLQGHTDLVSCVAVSTDGTTIVSGSYDKTVRVWDAQRGIAVGQPLEGHTDRVRCVAVSADGSWILSGSGDKTLRVWDAQGGNLVGRPLTNDTVRVECAAMFADGTRIVSGSDDNMVRVWEAQSGNAVGPPLQGHTDAVMCVAVSADGSRIASGSRDWTVRVWDAQSGEAVGQPLQGHTSWVTCVVVSTDGTRIVSGSSDKTVRVWDTRSGKTVGQPLRGHADWVILLAVSADGTRIVSGTQDHVVRLWDARSGNLVGQPLRGDNFVYAEDVVVSADGSNIVWVGECEPEQRFCASDEYLVTSADAAWERTRDPFALTWSTYASWAVPEVRHSAEDGSWVVLGTCERGLLNLGDCDTYFDEFFRSCRIVR